MTHIRNFDAFILVTIDISFRLSIMFLYCSVLRREYSFRGWHGGSVSSTVALQQDSPGFLAWVFLHGVYKFSQWLREFSLSA